MDGDGDKDGGLGGPGGHSEASDLHGDPPPPPLSRTVEGTGPSADQAHSFIQNQCGVADGHGGRDDADLRCGSQDGVFHPAAMQAIIATSGRRVSATDSNRSSEFFDLEAEHAQILKEIEKEREGQLTNPQQNGSTADGSTDDGSTEPPPMLIATPLPQHGGAVKLRASQILSLVDGDETIVANDENEHTDRLSSSQQAERKRRDHDTNYTVSLGYTESTAMSNTARIAPSGKQLLAGNLPGEEVGGSMTYPKSTGNTSTEGHLQHALYPKYFNQGHKHSGDAADENELSRMRASEQQAGHRTSSRRGGDMSAKLQMVREKARTSDGSGPQKRQLHRHSRDRRKRSSDPDSRRHSRQDFSDGQHDAEQLANLDEVALIDDEVDGRRHGTKNAFADDVTHASTGNERSSLLSVLPRAGSPEHSEYDGNDAPGNGSASIAPLRTNDQGRGNNSTDNSTDDNTEEGTSETRISEPAPPAPPHMHAVSAVLVTDDDANLDERRSNARREGVETARRELVSEDVVAKVTVVEERRLCNPRLVTVGIIMFMVVVGGVVGVILALQSSDSGAPATSPTSTDRGPAPTMNSLMPTTSLAPSSLPTVSAVPSSQPTVSLEPSSQPTIYFATEADKEVYLRQTKIAAVAGEVSGQETVTSDLMRASAVQWLQIRDRTITSATPRDIIAERYIMVLVYLTMDGIVWVFENNFMDRDETTCQWGSIVDSWSQRTLLKCDEDDRITEIYTDGAAMTFVLPSEVGALGRLARLELSRNQIRGEIPTELGNLSSLTHLDLHSNAFTGEVPSELGRLSNLEVLSVSSNGRLSGTLPSSLASLPQLTELEVEKSGIDNVQNVCDAGLEIPIFIADCLKEGFDCDCCSKCCKLDGSNKLQCE